MDLNAFFNYPTTEEVSTSSDLVFLPNRTHDDWATLIAHCETRRFHPGDLLITIGEVDRSLLISTTGELEVLVPAGRGGRFQRLSTLSPGTVVGEVAFFDGRPRSASIRALTDGEALRLSFDAFEVLAARHPELARAIVFDLGRILAVRLRAMTHVMSHWVS